MDKHSSDLPWVMGGQGSVPPSPASTPPRPCPPPHPPTPSPSPAGAEAWLAPLVQLPGEKTFFSKECWLDRLGGVGQGGHLSRKGGHLSR